MKYCTSCGSPIPDDQGSNSCSICYGDIDHGKDGYYREYYEEQMLQQEYEQEVAAEIALEISRQRENLYE